MYLINYFKIQYSHRNKRDFTSEIVLIACCGEHSYGHFKTPLRSLAQLVTKSL